MRRILSPTAFYLALVMALTGGLARAWEGGALADSADTQLETQAQRHASAPTGFLGLLGVLIRAFDLTGHDRRDVACRVFHKVLTSSLYSRHVPLRL